MTTFTKLSLIVAAAALAGPTCTSKDYILTPPDAGPERGTGGAGQRPDAAGPGIGGNGERPVDAAGGPGTGGVGLGGYRFEGTGAAVGGVGGMDGIGGTPFGIGGNGIGGRQLPGTGGVGTGGMGVGGYGIGGTGIGGAPGTNCGQETTLADCQARGDCHPVYVDPHDCTCLALGCCARFALCGNGGQADCRPPAQFACTIATTYCESPYVISYRNDCYEGCVEKSECAP